MTMLPKSIQLYFEFEPIVKLLCEETNCQNNLVNAANSIDDEMLACNLKQLIIGKDGKCLCYKPIEKKNEN